MIQKLYKKLLFFISMIKKAKKEINPLMLVLAVSTFFVFVVSFTAFYTKENFDSPCGCNLPIWVIIIAISSFGMFVGSLLYYLLNKNILKEQKNTKKAIYRMLDFLDNGEKNVMKVLIDNSGEAHQSKISKDAGIDKVKTSRIIKQLINKGFIRSEKNGMTNLIILDDELKDLFS